MADGRTTIGSRPRPAPGPTVGAGFARGLAELAVQKGADLQALLDGSGLQRAELEDQDARITFSAYVALMRRAKALTGDPALALHYGETVDISRVSIVGLIGQAAATMADSFVQLNRYVPLIAETENEDDGPRFRMALDARGLWLLDARKRPNDFPELTESAFAQLVCGPRRHGVPVVLRAVHLTHADPGYRAEYERIFGAPAVFDSDRNGLLFEPMLMHHPVERLPRYAFGVLTDHADARLRELQASKATRGQVEALLMPVLHTGETSMETVAGRLGLSRQTLLRKLKAEGVTFEQVLDALRHRLALEYLGGRKVSVQETAYLLGFSDPAAFSRAFKRWTGLSPKAMRERLAPGG